MSLHYLLDVSWLLYRGAYALQHAYNEYPELHFLCKKIESLLSRKDCDIFLCLDGAKPKGRRILGEVYKVNRHKEGSYNVYEGLASFIHLLNNSRIHVLYNENYESDEIIFTLSRTLDGRKKILSGDKDLLQSLTEGVIIDNGRNLVITEESYKYDYADTFFGIEPKKLPIFRAIVGDASDNLKPPVKRFPKKIAAKLVNAIDYDGECPTVEQIKNSSLEFSDNEKKWIGKLVEEYQLFSVYFDVMKLNVIKDGLIGNEYNYKDVELDEFLKSKITKLNTL